MSMLLVWDPPFEKYFPRDFRRIKWILSCKPVNTVPSTD